MGGQRWGAEMGAQWWSLGLYVEFNGIMDYQHYFVNDRVIDDSILGMFKCWLSDS